MSLNNSLENYYDTKGEDYVPSKARTGRILKLSGKLSGKRVLDMGCAGGELGVFLKKNGASYVAGCDISEKNILRAKNTLDHAFVFNVEQNDFSPLVGAYDIVIAMEIIEHLFRPEQFLLKLSQSVLSPESILILTTPNFLVFSNRIKMLFGKFGYTDIGLFDRGHIHFYTYGTLIKDIQHAGLSVVVEDHIIHPKIPRMLGKLFPSLFAYQFVVSVKKRS
jgi:2-polyprenyl-3-methyl-5-hydroxy-6-metoxy-1,4-benzoquinol methylase